MKLSIIVPCYNSMPILKTMVSETIREIEKIPVDDYEIILVNDCSPKPETIGFLKEIADTFENIKVVDLARNGGQANAQVAALHYVTGDAVLNMDDDMQTHPSQLHFLLEEIEKGYDIVYGYYPDKKHSTFRNFGSFLNYITVRILIGKPKDMKTSSYWVIRKFVRDYVIQYQSPYTHLQGLFLRTTRNISCVPIKHFEREVGQSGYTLKKLIQLYSNIMGYSVVPLRLSTYCGYFFSILSILGALIIVIRKLVNPMMALGWPSMMCAICFFSGLIMLFMGTIGEYLGRMFLGMNKQPQFVVREVISQNSTAAAIQDTANTPDKVTTVKPVLPTETISAKNSCEPSDNE